MHYMPIKTHNNGYPNRKVPFLLSILAVLAIHKGFDCAAFTIPFPKLSTRVKNFSRVSTFSRRTPFPVSFRCLLANRHISHTSMSSTSNNQSTKNPLKELGFQNPLILGSGSFTRKLILKEMGIPYHLMVRSIDEKGLGDRTTGSDPSELVTLLARAKADHLVSGILEVNYEDENKTIKDTKIATDEKDSLALPEAINNEEGWILLTADQVVTHNKEILEKPTSLEEAQSFVKRYAHSPPATVGSCYLTHIPTLIQVGGVDTATIHFKPSVAESTYEEMSMDLVQKLVKEGEPVLKCAGGLMVEHELTKEHIDRIDGTEDSVMGLSKDLVLQLLKEIEEKLKEYKR